MKERCTPTTRHGNYIPALKGNRHAPGLIPAARKVTGSNFWEIELENCPMLRRRNFHGQVPVPAAVSKESVLLAIRGPLGLLWVVRAELGLVCMLRVRQRSLLEAL